jgi:hypothetical protein
MRQRRLLALGLIGGLFAGTTAQFRRGRPPRTELSSLPAPPQNLPYDGRFTFARLVYECAPGCFYYRNEPSWEHGYPDAEMNLMAIIATVTSIRPRRDMTRTVAIDDPTLFHYPVSYMTESGYWVMPDKEADVLRKYLRKGGFLILDDTRDGFSPGNMGYANIEANFKRIFPELRFVDLTVAHPIFHSFFDIPSFDVVHQYYDRGPPVFRAIFEDNDPSKRIMVLLNFNTDVSNFWEFSAQGFVPVEESNEAYKLGVNYLVYALTH